MTEVEDLREKIDKTMEAVEPIPDPFRWRQGQTLVDIQTGDATAFGGRTIIGGVDVSGLVQKIEISLGVGDVNRVTLHLIAMPIQFKGMAELLFVTPAEGKDAVPQEA